MAESKGMKFAKWARGGFGMAEWLSIRRAVRRAKEITEKGCPTAKESAEKDALEIRIAMARAGKLMKKKRLTSGERKERDSIVRLLGERGNSREHDILKEWAVSGRLCCRPEPGVLAGAIAAGGLDNEHLKVLVAAVIYGRLGERGSDGKLARGRAVPLEEQYYFARLLSAESGLLMQRTLCNGQGVLTLVEERAARVAAFIESQDPGMVEKLKKEMEG